MGDTERNEDQKIGRCLQETFGYTDEQLLKRLDRANETLKNVTFDGAEDRIMKKIMGRRTEMEKAAPERKITLLKAKPENKKEKKVIWFGKKKVLSAVALVVVIVGMVVGTAIGRKNSFFRKAERSAASIAVDNDKNKSEKSRVENAYQEMSSRLKLPVLKMSYYPTNIRPTEVKIFKDQAHLFFTYDNNIISSFRTRRDNSISAQPIWNGFLHVTVKILNSYMLLYII